MADLCTSEMTFWLDNELARHVRAKHRQSYGARPERIRTVIDDRDYTREKARLLNMHELRLIMTLPRTTNHKNGEEKGRSGGSNDGGKGD